MIKNLFFTLVILLVIGQDAFARESVFRMTRPMGWAEKTTTASDWSISSDRNATVTRSIGSSISETSSTPLGARSSAFKETTPFPYPMATLDPITTNLTADLIKAVRRLKASELVSRSANAREFMKWMKPKLKNRLEGFYVKGRPKFLLEKESQENKEERAQTEEDKGERLHLISNPDVIEMYLFTRRKKNHHHSTSSESDEDDFRRFQDTAFRIGSKESSEQENQKNSSEEDNKNKSLNEENKIKNSKEENNNKNSIEENNKKNSKEENNNKSSKEENNNKSSKEDDRKKTSESDNRHKKKTEEKHHKRHSKEGKPKKSDPKQNLREGNKNHEIEEGKINYDEKSDDYIITTRNNVWNYDHEDWSAVSKRVSWSSVESESDQDKSKKSSEELGKSEKSGQVVSGEKHNKKSKDTRKYGQYIKANPQKYYNKLNNRPIARMAKKESGNKGQYLREYRAEANKKRPLQPYFNDYPSGYHSPARPSIKYPTIQDTLVQNRMKKNPIEHWNQNSDRRPPYNPKTRNILKSLSPQYPSQEVFKEDTDPINSEERKKPRRPEKSLAKDSRAESNELKPREKDRSQEISKSSEVFHNKEDFDKGESLEKLRNNKAGSSDLSEFSKEKETAPKEKKDIYRSKQDRIVIKKKEKDEEAIKQDKEDYTTTRGDEEYKVRDKQYNENDRGYKDKDRNSKEIAKENKDKGEEYKDDAKEYKYGEYYGRDREYKNKPYDDKDKEYNGRNRESKAKEYNNKDGESNDGDSKKEGEYYVRDRNYKDIAYKDKEYNGRDREYKDKAKEYTSKDEEFNDRDKEYKDKPKEYKDKEKEKDTEYKDTYKAKKEKEVETERNTRQDFINDSIENRSKSNNRGKDTKWGSEKKFDWGSLSEESDRIQKKDYPETQRDNGDKTHKYDKQTYGKDDKDLTKHDNQPTDSKRGPLDEKGDPKKKKTDKEEDFWNRHAHNNWEKIGLESTKENSHTTRERTKATVRQTEKQVWDRHGNNNWNSYHSNLNNRADKNRHRSQSGNKKTPVYFGYVHTPLPITGRESVFDD